MTSPWPILALSFFVSCGKKTETNTAQPPKETVIESLSLQQTKYDSMLNPQQYPEQKYTDSVPLLRWSFSDTFFTRYQLSQEMLSSSSFNLSQSASTQQQQMTASGIIEIQGSVDSSASLHLLDLQSTVITGPEDAPQTFTQSLPPVTIQGMQEDGQFSSLYSGQKMGTDVLFQLPQQQLGIGESISIPAESTFNAMGSLLIVKGSTVITLQQMVIIDGTLCAQLYTQTVIDQLDIPETLQGEYSFLEQTESILYFAIKQQQFIEGTAVALMEFSIDAPNPQTTINGESSEAFPSHSTMMMKSESLLQYTLE